MYEIDVTPNTLQPFQTNQQGNSVQISENAMSRNVSDPNETPEAIRAAYRLIVAVDIGTTYTKVAWCWTVTPPAEPEAHLFVDGQWEDYGPGPEYLCISHGQTYAKEDIKDIVLDYIRTHGTTYKTKDIKWVL